MLFFFFILLITVLLSLLPERFIKPQAAIVNQYKITLISHSLIITMLFLSVSLIVQRPIFSGLAVLIFHVILVTVNNAKFKALREPLVFSDIAMFSQAFKHPRLYFPFLGMTLVILAPIFIISLIIIVLSLEPALPFTFSRIAITLIAILCCFYLIRSIAIAFNLSQQPETDNAQIGLLNSLFAYSFQAKTQAHKQKITETLNTSPFSEKLKKTSNTKPNSRQNITVIQSESFFDARRLHPSIKTSILESFDICNATSIQYGKLEVPAWGANTMRTEFSFLSGLSNKEMGLYRFYPYQYLYQMPVSSIASALKAQGYYCVCIHPHPASFFGRDRIFPKMGFDEFIDIGSFEDAKKFGPYISDQAVTDQILEITQQITDKPLFIFAITMENHGPLHLEKITKAKALDFYSSESNNKNGNNSQLTQSDDLSIYLQHLKNADKMIKTLCQTYRAANAHTETTLCFYGDHVPSMPNVFKDLNYNDNCSDYFIWSSSSLMNNKPSNINTDITNLAKLLIPKATK